MIGFFSSALLYVVPLLAILTLVVTIHELGHFFAGKVFGVAMDRFSIGFGKALWSRTDRSGVEWRIGSIPLGGYVRFAGDTNDASIPDSEDLDVMRRRIEASEGAEAVKRFHPFKPLWQRAVIAAAGPVANFLLAMVIFTVVLLFLGEPISPPVVGAVAPGTPAAQAGFLPGDHIDRINGKRVSDFGDISVLVSLRAREAIRFDITRAGSPLTLVATPTARAERDPATGLVHPVGRIGLVSGAPYQQHYNLFTAFARSGTMTVQQITTTLTYLRRIVTGYESGNQISSVIGMGYQTGKVLASAAHVEVSFALKAANVALQMALLTAAISIGVGFVNLLPIPVLDGGHLLFYAYEAAARRPAGPRLQAASLKVGLALVLCMMLFATWNDLQRLQAFKFLGGLFS